MPTYTISSWRTYMPDLENLKKQAKLLLRWHREKHYPVAAQIREFLPRFTKMTDAEILAASFKLSDAQETVARQNGFDGWKALKTGLASAGGTVRAPPLKAKIAGAGPRQFV